MMKLFMGEESEEKFKKVYRTEFFRDRQNKVFTYDNAYILPLVKATKGKQKVFSGGVIDKNLEFVAGVTRKRNAITNRDVPCGYDFDKNSVDNYDETVIFGGVFFGVFGHDLLDGFTRLWFWLEKDCPRNVRIVFVCEETVKSYLQQFLDLLDIAEERVLWVKKPSRFARVIVPEESAHTWSDYSKDYLRVYDYMKQKCESLVFKKVYLSRTKFVKQDCFNEQYFEEFYKRRGYAIVSPETYSIAEQISIISHAEEIVCTMGTLSHLALFCNQGAKLTILLRLSSQCLIPQLLINKARDLDCCIVDVAANILPASRADAVYLLAPTRHWKTFLDSTNEIYVTPELDLPAELFKQSIIGYSEAWMKLNNQKSNYDKIRKFDMYEALKRLNDLFGSTVPFEDECSKAYYINQESEAEKILEKMKDRFEKTLHLFSKYDTTLSLDFLEVFFEDMCAREVRVEELKTYKEKYDCVMLEKMLYEYDIQDGKIKKESSAQLGDNLGKAGEFDRFRVISCLNTNVVLIDLSRTLSAGNRLKLASYCMHTGKTVFGPSKRFGVSIREQFKNCKNHFEQDFASMLDVLYEIYPQNKDAIDFIANHNYFVKYELLCMTKKEFDDLTQWLFYIFEKLKSYNVKTNLFYIGQRLLSFYVFLHFGKLDCEFLKLE